MTSKSYPSIANRILNRLPPELKNLKRDVLKNLNKMDGLLSEDQAMVATKPWKAHEAYHDLKESYRMLNRLPPELKNLKREVLKF